MKYRVKPIQFEEKYLDQTLNFLTKFSPDHPELGDKDVFLWQRCKRYLVIISENIIGHMAVINQRFRLNGSVINIGWGATLVLDMTDFAAKTFAGTALLDQCMHDTSYVYAAMGIVPEIEPTYKRGGYVVCRESVKMYARFFDSKKALRYYDKSLVYAIPIGMMNIIRPSRTKSPMPNELEEVAQLNPELDKIWDKHLREQYEIYSERTAEYLNYKIKQPHKEYIIFLHKDPSGETDGYIILRIARNMVKALSIVKICDLVGSPSARLALLAHAIDFAKRSRVDGIVGLSSGRDEHIYRTAGLWLSRPFPLALRAEFEGKFHVTFFDSDLDNLW
jgi:hypothetical protein